MFPRETAQEAISVAQHPATRAWCRLTERNVVPESVEIIQERVRRPEDIYRTTAKPAVYRLTGIGPAGANVIAKRCDASAISIECTIYESILPCLPVSTVRYYGLVPDDNQQFCWLLLEDAGDEPYLLELEGHRVLAGHWLGVMNTSAQQLHATTQLPDRGPDYYFQRLIASRETIREIVEHSRFRGSDSDLLRTTISHCNALEGQWKSIERFCQVMPRTLVHGDFAVQNARIRTEVSGKSLMVLDWEGAGWGIPAADLSQFVGESLSPDLDTYYSAVKSSWPGVGLADLESLAELGRMFRLINSLDWANWGYRAGSTAVAEWYMGELRWYERELADWLTTADAQHN